MEFLIGCKDLVQVFVEQIRSFPDLIKLRSVCKTFQMEIDRQYPKLLETVQNKSASIHWIIFNGDHKFGDQVYSQLDDVDKTFFIELLTYGILDMFQNTTYDDSCCGVSEHDRENITKLESLLDPRNKYWEKLWSNGKFQCCHDEFIGGWCKMRQFFIARLDVFSKYLSPTELFNFFFIYGGEFAKYFQDRHIVFFGCHIPTLYFDNVLKYFKDNLTTIDVKNQELFLQLAILAMYSAQSDFEKYMYGFKEFKNHNSERIGILPDYTFPIIAFPCQSVDILQFLIQYSDELLYHKRLIYNYRKYIGYCICSIKDERYRKEYETVLRKLLHESMYVRAFSFDIKDQLDVNCPLNDISYRTALSNYAKDFDSFVNDRALVFDLTFLFSLLHDQSSRSKDIENLIQKLVLNDKIVIELDFRLISWIISQRTYQRGCDRTTTFITKSFVDIIGLKKRRCRNTNVKNTFSLVCCVLEMQNILLLKDLSILFSYSREPIHGSFNVMYKRWCFHGKCSSSLFIFFSMTTFRGEYFANEPEMNRKRHAQFV